METFVVTVWAGTLLLVTGIAFFGYFLRTGKRWAQGVAVVLMALGILTIHMFW